MPSLMLVYTSRTRTDTHIFTIKMLITVVFPFCLMIALCQPACPSHCLGTSALTFLSSGSLRNVLSEVFPFFFMHLLRLVLVPSHTCPCWTFIYYSDFFLCFIVRVASLPAKQKGVAQVEEERTAREEMTSDVSVHRYPSCVVTFSL